jgi:hypothetical protein
VRSAREALKAEICRYLTRGFPGDCCLMRFYESDCFDVVDEAVDDGLGFDLTRPASRGMRSRHCNWRGNLSRGAARAGPILVEPRGEALTHALLTDLRRQPTSVRQSACSRCGKPCTSASLPSLTADGRISKIAVNRGAAQIPAPSAVPPVLGTGLGGTNSGHQLRPVAAHDPASTGLTG